MNDLLVPFALAFTGTEPVCLSTTGSRRFRKDAIRVGKFVARNPIDGTDLHLNVTPERISKWIAANKLMRDNGVSVDLTKDHKRGADSKIGSVDELLAEGDVLHFDLTAADDDAAKLLQRCPEVSIEIEPNVKDGKGNVYGEAITAITVCRKPVIPGQQPFIPIAASREVQSDTAAPPLIIFSRNQPDEPLPKNQESDMLTKEQRAEAIKKLGLKNDATDKQVTDAIMLSLDTAPGSQDKIIELQTELDKSKQANTDLQAKLDAGDKPITLSREVEVMSKRMLKGDLDKLVEQGCIAPAVVEKLMPELSKPIMLSIGAGADEPNYATIVNALAENKGLADLLGEQTGGQTLTLSRQVPGGDDGTGNALLDDLKSHADANN